MLRLVPPEFDPKHLSEPGYIEKSIASKAQCSDFLQSSMAADGCIKGSRKRLSATTSCPRTKYEAIFDGNMEYDYLRDAFLVAGSDGCQYARVACNIQKLMTAVMNV